MILDHELTFSDRQQLIANGTSTNTIAAPQAAPAGESLALHVTVIEESDTVLEIDDTAPSLAVTLQDSADGVTFADVVTVNKPAARRVFGLSLEGLPLRKFLRLGYTLGGDAPAYTITAALVLGESYGA